jgi:MFS superfamily sulfate permease-like transporter
VSVADGIEVGILVGVGIATVFLIRHWARNIDNIGEARFDTRNKSDRDG